MLKRVKIFLAFLHLIDIAHGYELEWAQYGHLKIKLFPRTCHVPTAKIELNPLELDLHTPSLKDVILKRKEKKEFLNEIFKCL